MANPKGDYLQALFFPKSNSSTLKFGLRALNGIKKHNKKCVVFDGWKKKANNLMLVHI